MSHYYFGSDARGYFSDSETGERCYMSHALWLQIIEAASVPSPSPGDRVKLSIKEQISVQVYEGGALVKSAILTPDTTEI